MKNLSRNAIVGYPAGIITGIAYGLNPLFAMPLMQNGAAIESILFFRYLLAVLLLGMFILLKRESFKVSLPQAGILVLLGALFTTSSLCLFGAYNYIASGLATTLIFLYPALVAIIMVFLGIPIESISKMMGHTNIRTTQIYARVTDDKISEDMDKLMEKRNSMVQV